MSDGLVMMQTGLVSTAYHARVRAGLLEADAGQLAVIAALDRVAGDFDNRAAPAQKRGWLARLTGGNADPAPVRGLYLWGGVGRGKSMLMDLLAEAAPLPKDQIRRVHFHAFMQEVQAGLEVARKAGEQDAVRPVAEKIAATTKLLCFDEMQITDIADAMIVGRLFEGLFARGVTVVTTSNRVPEDLYKNGLNRQLFVPFIHLIREKLEVVELASPLDHRQNRLRGEPVWFTPLGDGSDRLMEGAWDNLTGCAEPEALSIAVNARKLELPAYCDGVGRVAFDDICGRALGPADYLALADAVEVLMLDRIPILGSGNYDRAKRFVTLIDALYEAKVRLVASAAAEPEDLYPTGTGSFEFERTASRLREMQDAKWGR